MQATVPTVITAHDLTETLRRVMIHNEEAIREKKRRHLSISGALWCRPDHETMAEASVSLER
jgi:hypothetical protein